MRSGTRNKLLAVVLCVCIAGTTQAEGIIYYYVDGAATGTGDGSSWANAYTDLQDALTAAAATIELIEIRVAQGTYRPRAAGADLNPTFQLLNGVTLKGGYAGATGSDPDARDVKAYPTILSGNEARPNPEAASYVVTDSWADSSAVLDGFTIVSGRKTGMGGSYGNPVVTDCTFLGCGFYSSGEGNSTLTRCSFVDMSGPMIPVDIEGNGLLTECSFVRCGSTSGVCQVWGDLTARDCTFTESYSGAVHCLGTLDLIGCSFLANGQRSRGHAVECQSATVQSCKFISNSGRLSGTIYAAGDLLLVDCEFIGNVGSSGGAITSGLGNTITASGCVFAGNRCTSAFGAGAIYAVSNPLRLSNCTFVRNRGKFNAVYWTSWDVSPEITQCIVWDGPNPFASVDSSVSDVSVTYNDVEGGWPGNGNIDVDPCFVDPGHWDLRGTPDNLADDIWVTGDYHLKSQAGHWDRTLKDWVYDDVTSPCIDAGDPNAPVGDEPVPNGGRINMGAYGGTVEASRTWSASSVYQVLMPGDINGDHKVDDPQRNSGGTSRGPQIDN